MKKQLLLLAFMFLSLAVNAQDAVEIDGIYYNSRSDKVSPSHL